ncbi:MAG: hypothetical protein WBG73_14255 [Coleofasciculaceae cyanobacterium]
MNFTTKRRNLRRALFSSAALASMFGGMILTASSAKAIEVRTEANLDRGYNRISVDLTKFVKEDIHGRVRPNCRGDLNSGQLVIKCDVSKYVEGGGNFPFRQTNSNITPELEQQTANTNR